MKRIGILSAAFIAMLTVACGGDTANDTAANRETPSATSPATPGAAGTAGEEQNQTQAREFVNEMAITNMAEIQLGNMAEKQATSPQVKQFAQMMVQDHTKANDELKQIASQLNVQLPTELDEKHRELSEKLSKLQGEEFDREYMSAMVDGHEEAINKVEDRANRANQTTSSAGTESGQATGTAGSSMQGQQALNQWATKTLPTLRKHLQQAEQINEKVGQNQ